jgi:RND family efflux transporter MFP subunit/putative MATE family efflux protein
METSSVVKPARLSGRMAPARMLGGAIVWPMITLAAPMVTVLVAQTLVGVAEAFYVGRLGTETLAGATLVFPLTMLMTMMANGGIGGGVASAIARATGAGRHDDADALAWHAVVLALLFGSLFTAGAIVLGPRLYGALGGRAGVLDAAITYSTFMFAAAIPTWIANLMAASLRGVGNVSVPALVTLLGSVLLMPLSPLLIFGLGPVPRLGIAGAGIAVMVYYVGAALFLGWYLASGRGGLTLRIGRLRWVFFAAILKVGLISALGTLITNLTVVVVTGLIGRFGADAIAGYGAASRLDFILIPLLFGLGTAVVTMVGVNIGAGQEARARRIAWTGAAIAAVFCETIGIAAALFPDVWNGLFTHDRIVLNEGAIYLHRVAPAYGFVGLGMLLYFAAQGTGRMLVPFLAGLARLGVAAGVGWYCVACLGADMPTLFLVVSAAAVVFGAVNMLGALFQRPKPASGSAKAVRNRGVRNAVVAAVAVVAVLSVVAIPLLGRAQRAETAVASRPPVVRTVVVMTSPTAGRRFTGVIHARYESALGFRVSGKIAERMVDAGDRVRKGQPLMRLDPTDFELASKAAHAAVESARAISIQAASDEARRRRLLGEGWVTAQVYEQNKAAADAAAAQLRSALAQETQADDQAAYAVLAADADGVIMEAPGEPGQVVTAGQAVVRLAHEGPREAEIYLPEGTERQAGDTAVASLYANPNQSIPARLRELSSMADPATRTYRARYVLEGPGKNAPLGATVTVRLSEKSARRPVYEIPIGAIVDNGNGPLVWRVDEVTSTVSSRLIDVVRMGEESAVVSGALDNGERIVALGAQLLRSGEKVEIGSSPLDTAAR